MHAFSQAWSLPVMRQRWGYTIWSAVTENPMLRANLMALSFIIEPELWAIKVYIAGIRIVDLFCSCDLDLDPMTFIDKLDSYSLEIHRVCKYELPTPRLSKISVWQTYRLTDMLHVITSGHVTKTAVTPLDLPHPKTPCNTRKLDGSIFSSIGVMGDQSLHCGIGIFDNFAPLTLTLTKLTHDLHIQIWPVLPGDTPDVQIWTSYVNVFESYRLTDRQTDRQTNRQRDKLRVVTLTIHQNISSLAT